MDTNQVTGSSSYSGRNSSAVNPSTEEEVASRLFHPANPTTGNYNLDRTRNFDSRELSVVLHDNFRGVTGAAKDSIRLVASFMGKLFNRQGHACGGCLLISNNLILTTLHCAVDALNYGKGAVCFNHNGEEKWLRLDRIVAGDNNRDIAVVQLSQDTDFLMRSMPQLSLGVLDGERAFLLHYPYPHGDLMLSANIVQISKTCDGHSIITSHDSSNGSCGGIYIRENGELIGIHMGDYSFYDREFNREKYIE